jgi:NAD(P)-dependent dehydrogenase (short-subunit alcohol dehydrogenase family)
MEIAGKVVLVTGGGRGIGAGIAEAFLEAGARVALTDLDRPHAAAEAGRLGQGAIALSHDVTSLDSWNAVRREVESSLGPVDILCNNAGIALPFMPLEEVDPSTFDRVMAVNVRGVYNGCATFLPAMKERRSGHIVNTSSANGIVPHGTFAAYCASKFAVAGLSEALRIELEPFDVGVSILYPGLTRSRMAEAQMPGLSPEARDALQGRMMEPVWLGRAVVRAVEHNHLHIITHPDLLGTLQMRLDRLLASFGDPAHPGYNAG